jgi:putative ABC transport system substrate-binding protein
MASHIERRKFLATLGGAVAWPLAARGQQAAMPVVGFVSSRSLDGTARHAAAFTKGLSETGYVEGQNVVVEYHWLSGQNDRLPALMADLVRRRVAVIATAGDPPTLAAKAATATIPIAFGTRSGIGWSPAWPVRAATRLASIFLPRRSWPSGWGFCANWCPRPSVLSCWSTRPIPPSTESTLRDVPEAARAIGLQTQILNASTSREIEAAFATIALDRADALFVAPDGFFNARRVQFATLATHYRIPAAYATREVVETGGLMSYGTDVLDMYRQVGVYAGRILKGANPTDLPVVQSTKFEFVINLQTARALGIEVPNSIQLLADELIE